MKPILWLGKVVTFRTIPTLMNLIIPFFLQHPLLASESYEFESRLVAILYSQAYIGDTLSARDALVEFAFICRELNSKRNTNKEDKNKRHH